MAAAVETAKQPDLEIMRQVPPSLATIPAPEGCRLPGFVRCLATVLCRWGSAPHAVDPEAQAKAFLDTWTAIQQLAPGFDLTFQLDDLKETVLELIGRRGRGKQLTPLESSGFCTFMANTGISLPAGAHAGSPAAAATTSHMVVGSAVKQRAPLAEISLNTLPATVSNMMAGSKRVAHQDDQEDMQTPAKKTRRPPDSLEEVLAWVRTVLPCDADWEQAAKVIREECIDGEALLGMQPEEVKSVLGLKNQFACQHFQKALADLQGVVYHTSPAKATPADRTSDASAVTLCQSPASPSPGTASVGDYDTWRTHPLPPSPAEVVEWLFSSSLSGQPRWEPAEVEAIHKVVTEQHVDAKVLCDLRSLEQVKDSFRLDDVTAAKVWEKIQILKLVALRCPWGFPSTMPAADKKRVTIVVLGDTGAGKSTLLNALMGEKTLLPTNGMRACTAAIVELSFNHNMNLSTPYVGQVEFVSKAEWAEERKRLYASIRGKDGELMRWQPPDGTDAHTAWCKLRSVYGCIPPEAELAAADSPSPATVLAPDGPPAAVALWLRTVLGDAEGRCPASKAEAEEIDAETLLTMSVDEFGEVLGITDSKTLLRLQNALGQSSSPSRPAVARIAAVLGTTISESAPDAATLHTAMSRYVDSSNDSSEGALWPLVKRVQLKGPWECLAGGAVLVDAPGVQDDNSARDAVVKSYLRSADGVWLISNIRRAVNDKTVKDYLVPKYKQELVQHGLFGQLAFIATQTDILEASEIAENLDLPEGTSKVDCARARNAYTKKRVVKDFYQGVNTTGNAIAARQFSEVGGKTETVPEMPPKESATAAPNSNTADTQDYRPGDHWGIFQPVQVKEGIEEMRWTDNGSTLRDSVCEVGPPKELLAIQQSRFTLPVVTVSAVDYQRLAGVRSSDGSSTFSDLEGTEVLALRGLVHATVRARRAHIAGQVHAISEVSDRLKSTERLIRRSSLEGQQPGQPTLESGMVAGRVTSALFSAASCLRSLGARRCAGVSNPKDCPATSPADAKSAAVELSSRLVALCDATHVASSGGRMLQILEERQVAQDCEDEDEEGEEGCPSAESAPILYHLGPLGYSFSEPTWTCSNETAPPKKRLQDFNPRTMGFVNHSWTSDLRSMVLGKQNFTRVNCMTSEVATLNQVAEYIEKQNYGKITIHNVWTTPGGWASYRIRVTAQQGTLMSTSCGHKATRGERFCPGCRHPRPAALPAAVAHALANGQNQMSLAGIGFTAPTPQPATDIPMAKPATDSPKPPAVIRNNARSTTADASRPLPAPAVQQDDDVIDLTDD